VYVRPFPGLGAKWQVSTGGEGYGGIVWPPDGRQLFWLSLDHRIMVADCESRGSSFVAGKPRVWSKQEVGVNGFPRSFSSADGKRFAIIPPRELPAGSGSVHLTFALHFTDNLKSANARH
jgi:hypothetical protein